VMNRMWIAIAAAACLQSSIVSAQVAHLTVSTTATVHKAPSTGSPVIGQASRGMTIVVTRDVGDWVKVAWSQSPDGIGYIRKGAGTMGALAPAATSGAELSPGTTTAAPATGPAAAASQAAAATSAAPAGQAAPATTPRLAAAQSGATVRPQPATTPARPPVSYVAMPSHRMGVGGQIGGAAVGGGFSARGWTAGQRLGFQFDVVRYSMSNPVLFTQMTSTQVGPKVLFALRDHVTDRTWVRPYVGGGAHVLRATMTDPVTDVSMSDARLAAQLFGGTEATLAAVPRLGLSADVGYQWYQNQFAGYSLKGMTISATAHWYLR
jgi:hypothetical protein